MVVRDGVHFIRLCVLHHLALGVSRIHVVDNGSSDGTRTVLRRLAQRVPLSWTSDPGPYLQHVLTTGLAHEASRSGADWVLPIDHDEFWFSRDRLHDALGRAAPATAAVEAPLVNFVQARR